jgi:hypothetical protein
MNLAPITRAMQLCKVQLLTATTDRSVVHRVVERQASC